MTDKLIILNVPHPKGFLRELARNPVQRAASNIDAFKRVSFTAMLNDDNTNSRPRALCGSLGESQGEPSAECSDACVDVSRPRRLGTQCARA